MRRASFLLVGCLAVFAASCDLADVRETIISRQESTDYPALRCELIEEETVRIWGDFGQVIGSYAVAEDGSVRANLARCGRCVPGWIVLSVTRDTLTLQTPDGIQARRRRG